MENKPDLIAITEAKSKRQMSTLLAEFSIEGYNVISNDLENQDNRGLLIYISNKYESALVNVNSSFKEVLLVEIKKFNKTGEKLMFVNMYRSPNSVQDNNVELFKLMKEIIDLKFQKYVILGDFNFPGIDWKLQCSNNVIEMEFLNILNDNFLIQHIDTPTRHRGKDNPHVLDLVITNDDFVNSIDFLSPLGKSDHAVLDIVLTSRAEIVHENNKLSFEKGNYDEFRKYVEMDWKTVFESCSEDVEEMWNIFAETVNKGVEKFIPRIKPFNTKNGKYKRPLPEELRNLIHEKHRMFNKFRRTKYQEDFNNYKKTRNRVKKELNKLDREKQMEIARSSKANPKKFWKYVNSKRKCNHKIPDIVYVDSGGHERVAESAQDKVTVFNRYFSEVFNYEKLKQEGVRNFEDSDISCKMEPLFIDSTLLLTHLQSLNVSKSAGADGLHPRILKELSNEICEPLKIIFETSMKTGKLPSDWKQANITAIFKKGKRNSVCNYRPVSLTSVVCKVFEKLIRDHVMKYCISHDMFTNRQYGFIKGRSTVMQLLRVLDDWTELLENGGQIDVIYTDLEKAFDKVHHKILIQKLKNLQFDVNVLAWIEDFLTRRKQRVKIGDTVSDWSEVVSGIPQGSVLGPLLFIIFINDMIKECHYGSQIYLYADDSKIYKYVRNESDAKELQEDLYRIVNWINKNLLKLNVKKCTIVSYGRDIQSHRYSIGDINLERSESIKDLGVTFDDGLSFENHIKEKVKKANSMLGIIKRNFDKMPPETSVMLYKSLVRSHIEYAGAVWSPHHKKSIELIENVQKRATRAFCRDKNLSYEERLRYLNLPTLRFRRIRGDMIELYKVTHGFYDRASSVRVGRCENARTRGHQYRLFPKHVHYDLRKYFFSNRVINMWNSLPDFVVSACTISTFKKRLDFFWSDQDACYNWHCDITGTGDRSKV